MCHGVSWSAGRLRGDSSNASDTLPNGEASAATVGRPAAGRLPPALEAYIQWHGRALLANEPDTNYLIYSCRGNAYAGMSQRPASLSARSLTRGRPMWPAAMRTSRFRPASLRARAGHCNTSNDCSKDSADPPGGWCGGIGDRLRGITTLFYVTGAG